MRAADLIIIILILVVKSMCTYKSFQAAFSLPNIDFRKLREIEVQETLIGQHLISILRACPLHYWTGYPSLSKSECTPTPLASMHGN